MKLLLVSDAESKFIWDHFDPAAFSGVRAIISCGDLKRDYLEFLVTMIPAPLFYVPGNHDKSFITAPPEGCVSLDGNVIKHGGLTFCGLGGCKSPKPDTAYEYTEEVMAARVARLSKQIKRTGGIDIFVTHAPAKALGDGSDRFHEGFSCFFSILDAYSPKLYAFGHQHKAYNQATPPTYGKTRVTNAYGHTIVDVEAGKP